ncbi:MAG: TIGR01906 family membrane protein [Chloroflexi bacterium]|nr:TIGR01906 family membrane protein [Chloroflexota bacterium]MCI0580319.1 TIGR01906 family membrane protein [Chloroflexota bacterium]MCI0648534.1 TIGR01906 family membrane protein [Chloroflexota bacterium]MCI0728486.1 TIGR01906 family membrane protein [Chloroflexota bacterium]
MNKRLAPVVGWLVVVAMPFFLGFTTVTLIISEAYPRYQYSNPNFPEDRFGFTQEERLELALVAVGYLQRREPAEEVIYLLEQQRIPGSDEPLYNEREIGHMTDVKRVTDAIRRGTQIAGFIVAAGLVFLLMRPETRPAAYLALWRGGLATTAVLLVIALFILLGWSIFFVQFHELLFPPGTWTFSYSDSLIRLFPEKFWFDLGVLLSAGTLVEGVLVAAIGYFLKRRHREQGI